MHAYVVVYAFTLGVLDLNKFDLKDFFCNLHAVIAFLYNQTKKYSNRGPPSTLC